MPPPKKKKKSGPLKKRSKAVKQRVARYKRQRQDAGGDAREKYITKKASETRKDKIHGIEQSIGSLDRRINKAIEGGNLDKAKDLRSRQNKFTTDLGLERAIEAGGVLRDKEGRIVRSSTTGQPIMTGAGHDIFRETKDMDFIDPTRRIQNVGGDAYGKMYPVSNVLQKGPLVAQGLKSLFDKGKRRDIPYTNPIMPGQRYPLDEIIKQETITEEEPFFGGRSRDPNYKQPYLSYPGYNEEVKISDLVISDEDDDQENRILESQGIDENFIYPTNQETGEKEVGDTALQLAYQDEAEAALLKNLASHLDAQGRYTEKLPNPFFYPEEHKIKLREEAEKNKRVLSEKEKQILEDKGVSEHYLDMNPNTNLTEQTLSDVVDRENTTWGQVGSDALAGTLDTVGTLSGLNYFPPYDNMVNAAENYADSLDMTPTTMENINEDIAAGKAELKKQYHWLSDAQIDSLYNYNNQQSLF
jgi:hypothetical protein